MKMKMYIISTEWLMIRLRNLKKQWTLKTQKCGLMQWKRRWTLYLKMRLLLWHHCQETNKQWTVAEYIQWKKAQMGLKLLKPDMSGSIWSSGRNWLQRDFFTNSQHDLCPDFNAGFCTGGNHLTPTGCEDRLSSCSNGLWGIYGATVKFWSQIKKRRTLTA